MDLLQARLSAFGAALDEGLVVETVALDRVLDLLDGTLDPIEEKRVLRDIVLALDNRPTSLLRCEMGGREAVRVALLGPMTEPPPRGAIVPPGPSTPHMLKVRDVLWEAFGALASAEGKSVDDLVNDAMARYRSVHEFVGGSKSEPPAFDPRDTMQDAKPATVLTSPMRAIDADDTELTTVTPAPASVRPAIVVPNRVPRPDFVTRELAAVSPSELVEPAPVTDASLGGAPAPAMVPPPMIAAPVLSPPSPPDLVAPTAESSFVAQQALVPPDLVPPAFFSASSGMSTVPIVAINPSDETFLASPTGGLVSSSAETLRPPPPRASASEPTPMLPSILIASDVFHSMHGSTSSPSPGGTTDDAIDEPMNPEALRVAALDEPTSPKLVLSHPMPLFVIYLGKRVEVRGNRFVIGREPATCNLVLADANVSRKHAIVEFVDGKHYLVDQGSTNGVGAGGHRIHRKQIVEGDQFEICGHSLTFSFRV